MPFKNRNNRNYYALMIEGTLFFTGLAFLDTNSVVPVFIHTFTQSLQLAGLASTMGSASSLLAQLFMGPYIHRIKNLPAFISTIMFLFRPLPLLMVPILMFAVNPYIVVWAFLCIYALLWASDGLIVVPWLDVFGRTIPDNQRGKLLGNQQLFGGIGSLAAGFIIKITLENALLSSAQKYSILFGLSGILLLSSAVAMTFVKDSPRENSHKRINILEYYSTLPGYLNKNKAYRHMLATQLIGSLAGMILPFIILFGQNTFALSPNQVSTLIYIQIIGSLIGGLFWGNISHRLGNKYIILISQIINFTLPSLALISLGLHKFIPPLFFLVPMCVLGGINKGAWMGYTNYTIDITDEENRPVYFVLTSLITFPTTFLPYIAGIIADAWGFIPLFIIGMAAASIAINLALALKTPHRIE
ncbi:MFS transporter [Caldicoprobacter algeriensis]|uniref:MFS transporter n=1 Tax=Caldicoprobacter algeriensis TaxID=699281 RepID=UPI002079FB7E|nr:MFS transporter [Caldicoprobacter algeriensis]MCM8900963.1 MFS transporter [Caldicoprobacter algeriensis]